MTMAWHPSSALATSTPKEMHSWKVSPCSKRIHMEHWTMLSESSKLPMTSEIGETWSDQLHSQPRNHKHLDWARESWTRCGRASPTRSMIRTTLLRATLRNGMMGMKPNVLADLPLDLLSAVCWVVSDRSNKSSFLSRKNFCHYLPTQNLLNLPQGRPVGYGITRKKSRTPTPLRPSPKLAPTGAREQPP